MEKLLVTKKELRQIIGFSYAHIDRLETDPRYRHLEFPKRTRIGFKVFWCSTEIKRWAQKQLEKRSL